MTVEPVQTTTPATPTTPITPVKENPDSQADADNSDKTLLSEGDANADAAKETPKAPEKYEIKAPEGMEIDTALLDQVTPLFKEMGITQEQAQKLADVYAPHIQQMVQTQAQQASEAYKQQVEGWKVETMKALGATAKQDLAAAGKFIDLVKIEGLREILDQTGLGNHPAIVQAFVKAGKAISEDSFVEPSQTSSPSQDAFWKKMYPKMSEKK